MKSVKDNQTLILFATHNKSLVNKSDLGLIISNEMLILINVIKAINLKIHSQYSICEGAIKINQLSEFCKKNKVSAVGICDNENLSELEFSNELSKIGVQPIMEVIYLLKMLLIIKFLWKNILIC